MGAVRLITAKDIRLQFRNRSILILGFVAPLSLAFVLNLVFGGIDDPDAPVTFDVGLVDHDGGEAATAFTSVVHGLGGTGLLDVTTYEDEQAAREAVDDGTTGAVWVIPEGFSSAVDNDTGDGAEIVVVGDVDAPNAASLARAVAERYATSIGTATLAGLVAVETGVAAPADLGAVTEEAAGAPPLARLATLDASSSLLDPTTSLVAGLALFFVFFAAGLPLVSILEERGSGTLARLLVAPIPAGSILAGKALASILLGVTALVSLMVASTFVMGADWGSPAGALLLAVAAVVAATGLMAVAGSLARTAEQAANVQAVVAVVVAVLGGAFVPIPGSESGVLALLQKLTPNGWFLDGLAGLGDEGITGALPAVAVLLAIGVVTGAVAVRLSRSVLRR